MKCSLHAIISTALCLIVLPKITIAQQDPVSSAVLAPPGNNCPPGYEKVTTLPECRAAAIQFNPSNFAGTETTSDWPGGCYHCDSVSGCTDGVWFNYHEVGSANGGATPICKPMVAVAVVLAPPGNNCITGYEKLTTLPGCQAAASQLNLSIFAGTETDDNWPGGCYHCNSVSGCTNGVWFNYDFDGSANGGATPICAKPGWESTLEVETLFIGDSDIERWDTSSFSNSVNVGVGGFTCDDVSNIIDDSLLAYTPKSVVIVCGENDLWGQSASDTFNDFEVVIGKIIGSGARALYLGTKPEPSTTGLHSKYQNYDAKIREYAEGLAVGSLTPPLVMVDVYPAFVELGNPNSFYSGDRLHLSDEGYDYWTAWTATALDDTTVAQDCIRWMGDECVSSSSTTSTSSTTTNTGATATTTTVNCANDGTWKFTTRNLKLKGCNWVNRKPARRCDKIGVGDGGSMPASEACPGACDDACANFS